MKWPRKSKTRFGHSSRRINGNVVLDDYEIVLIDNGSVRELPGRLQTFASNLRYHYLSPNEAKRCPATAINQAVRAARSGWLCLMIDGARMVTPGVLSWALRLLELTPRSVVEVRGWHLGPKFQPDSVAEGYNSKGRETVAR